MISAYLIGQSLQLCAVDLCVYRRVVCHHQLCGELHELPSDAKHYLPYIAVAVGEELRALVVSARRKFAGVVDELNPLFIHCDYGAQPIGTAAPGEQ
ncbi:hypothetical protein Q1695_005944 [Nippostrongylus brasiliensis]|nr:hypothetical protein Q1695_005944 [Nippostrongylus brasiliensis]